MPSKIIIFCICKNKVRHYSNNKQHNPIINIVWALLQIWSNFLIHDLKNSFQECVANKFIVNNKKKTSRKIDVNRFSTPRHVYSL